MPKTGKVIENLAKTNNLKFDSIITNVENHVWGNVGHVKIPLNILEEKIDNV